MERLQTQQTKVIRVLSGRHYQGDGRGPWVTLCSPTAKSSLSLGSRPVRTPIAAVYPTYNIAKGVNTGTRGTVVLPVIHFASIAMNVHCSCHLRCDRLFDIFDAE